MYEMRKFLFILLSLLSCLCSKSQSGNSWYRCYAGTIGTYPVVIHLHKMGHSLAGYYYYNSTERPIYFVGNDTAAGKDKLILYGYTPADILTLSINKTTCTGIWKKDGEEGKTLPVNATEKNSGAIPGFDLYFI